MGEVWHWSFFLKPLTWNASFLEEMGLLCKKLISPKDSHAGSPCGAKTFLDMLGGQQSNTSWQYHWKKKGGISACNSGNLISVSAFSVVEMPCCHILQCTYICLCVCLHEIHERVHLQTIGRSWGGKIKDLWMKLNYAGYWHLVIWNLLCRVWPAFSVVTLRHSTGVWLILQCLVLMPQSFSPPSIWQTMHGNSLGKTSCFFFAPHPVCLCKSCVCFKDYQSATLVHIAAKARYLRWFVPRAPEHKVLSRHAPLRSEPHHTGRKEPASCCKFRHDWTGVVVIMDDGGCTAGNVELNFWLQYYYRVC